MKVIRGSALRHLAGGLCAVGCDVLLDKQEVAALQRARPGMTLKQISEEAYSGALAHLIAKGETGRRADALVQAGALEVGHAQEVGR
jgi:hypothetical protein